jgi:peptide/nickel transport system permease protein
MRREGRRATLLGAAVLGVLVLGSVGAGFVLPDATRTDLASRLAGPSAAHWLGQDGLGRDVLARIALGARVSFAVAGAVVAISVAVGVAVGSTAGLAGGWTDLAIARAIDVVLAFPGLLLAIALAAVRGPSVGNVVLALSVLGWTTYARLARSEAARIGHAPFVEAARALGTGPFRLAVRHVLPLAAPALLVQSTFGVSSAIVAEASLSFLGLGVPPPIPSWGGMLDEGRQFLLVAPHLVLAPGVALAVTVLALQLVGDGLRDWLDVRGARTGIRGARRVEQAADPSSP